MIQQNKKIFNFDKYKNSLKQYLSIKGFDVFQNPIFCFDPAHDNRDTPSMQLHEDGFNCHSCGIHGDIYDAAGLICGITDKKEQFKEVEATLGFTPTAGAVKKKEEPVFAPECRKELENYLKNHRGRDRGVSDFLKKRGYPSDFISKLSSRYAYWPGLDQATKLISVKTLEKAGIPIPKEDRKYSSWSHSGVIIRLGDGYKLMYYRDGKCEKRNSSSARTFPCPPVNKLPDKVILVEAETSALSMRAAGFENVFSTGGVNGITKLNAEKLSHVKKITFAFDGDNKGRYYSGLDEYFIGKDGARTKPKTAIDKIRAAGCNAEIFAVNLNDGTDPDDYIQKGDIKGLKATFDTAIPVKLESPQEEQEDRIKIYMALIISPTHAKFADLLAPSLLERNWLSTRISLNTFAWFRREKGKCYHEEIINRLDSISNHARKLLFEARDYCEAQNIELPKGFYSAFEKALQKAESRDFITAICRFLDEKLYEPDFNPDSTPWVVPCNDEFLADASKSTLSTRRPEKGEYFKKHVNVSSEDILKAPEAENFNKALSQTFPDPETRETFKMLIAKAISRTGSKTVSIHQNIGYGGKNTILDIISAAFDWQYSATPSGSLISRQADGGEKRFSSIEMRSVAFSIFDEVTGPLDSSALKRLSSLSLVRGEMKGQDAVHFMQTWIIFILTNYLPNFYPADDVAFLSRLLVIPYESCFYENKEQKENFLARGIKPDHLFPARKKNEIMEEMKEEQPGIIKQILNDLIKLRTEYNGDIPESPRCRQMREVYRSENDTAENFIEEYLTADKQGFISNTRLTELYHEYTGKKLSSQALGKMVSGKIIGVEKKTFRNQRGLIGVRENVCDSPF